MISPFYNDAAVTIFCGDAFELLPRLDHADHMITDPPYFSDWIYNPKTTPSANGRKTENTRSFEYEAFTSAEAPRLIAAANFTQWGLIFSEVENAHLYRQAAPPKYRHMRTGAWVKTHAQPQLTGDRPAAHLEAVTILHTAAKSRWNGGGRGNAWTHPIAYGGDRPNHPTPKPLPLIAELVSLFTQPGDLILDPFAGSGTLGRAAKDLGRRAILIEQHEPWAELAARRMAQEVLL